MAEDEAYRAHLTWLDAADVPEEHLEAIATARDGLLAGDVRPLIDYLRSERPVSFSLRHDLADLMEGKFAGGHYRLSLSGNTNDPITPKHRILERSRTAEIGRSVQARIHRGDKEMFAIQGAADQFGVSSSTARRKWKDYTDSFPAIRPQSPRKLP